MSEYSNIKTPVFRASFVNLYEAKARKKPDGTMGAPQFGLVAIFDPARFTEAEKALWASLVGIMDEKVREVFGHGLKDAPAAFKKGIRKCIERRDPKDGSYPPGFDVEGGLFVSLSANENFRPGVVDLHGSNVGPEWGNGDKAYSGAYMRASVRPYTYNHQVNRGIALGLQNVQVVGDGEPLAGKKVAAADDFSDSAIDTDTSRFAAPVNGAGGAPHVSAGDPAEAF